MVGRVLDQRDRMTIGMLDTRYRKGETFEMLDTKDTGYRVDGS